MSFNVLEFIEVEARFNGQTVNWMEYVIDQVPLAKWMTSPRGCDPIAGRQISPFGSFSSESADANVGMLLGSVESPLSSGRVPLYICSACGDLDCGATTVNIVRDEATVRWIEIGHETNYEEGFEQSPHLEKLHFHFEINEYDDAVRRFLGPGI